MAGINELVSGFVAAEPKAEGSHISGVDKENNPTAKLAGMFEEARQSEESVVEEEQTEVNEETLTEEEEDVILDAWSDGVDAALSKLKGWKLKGNTLILKDALGPDVDDYAVLVDEPEIKGKNGKGTVKMFVTSMNKDQVVKLSGEYGKIAPVLRDRFTKAVLAACRAAEKSYEKMTALPKGKNEEVLDEAKGVNIKPDVVYTNGKNICITIQVTDKFVSYMSDAGKIFRVAPDKFAKQYPKVSKDPDDREFFDGEQ